MWLGIIERWPDVRAALQNADYGDDFQWGSLRGRRLAEIRLHFFWRESDETNSLPDELRQLIFRKSAIIDRLPKPEESPELKQMILLLTEYMPEYGDTLYPEISTSWAGLATRIEIFDNALVEAGL